MKTEQTFVYRDRDDTVIITVKLMQGANPNGTYSRFRRNPVNAYSSSWRPIYLHGKGLAISRHYSEANMFIAKSTQWSEKLAEVPYLTDIKKMELVRKSGEIIEFSNDNNSHMKELYLAVDSDPIIEMRIY